MKNVYLVVGSVAVAWAVGLVTDARSQTVAAEAAWVRPPWASETVKEPWAGEQLTLYMALSKLAGDLGAVSPPPVIVLEGWNQDWVLIVREERIEGSLGASITSSMGFNPRIPLFSLDARGKTLGALLDEVCAKAGGQRWRYDARHQMVNIVQEELATDARWPLNWPLGEAATERLTLAEAHRLLERRFGWYEGATSTPLATSPGEYERLRDLVVWEPGAIASATVRDLLCSMIREVETFRSENTQGAASVGPYWYFVSVAPGIDPRMGYQALNARKRLRWLIHLRGSMNANDLQAQATSRADALIQQRAMFGEAMDRIVRTISPLDERE